MDLRLTFNSDAPSYDKLRPTYTAQLFEDVISFANLTADKRALEIGIGTGQATLPFLQTNCTLTAIELGANLAAFVGQKYAGYPNFDVINQDFESVPLNENAFDLIYSASAFHWIAPEVGLPKVTRLLKPGGVFAWISNQPSPAPEHAHIYDAFQRFYMKHPQFFGDKPQQSDPAYWQNIAKTKLDHRASLFREYGFTHATHATYYGSRTFTAVEYAQLISTYSTHKSMPADLLATFLHEIAEVIDANGGQFTLRDIVLLSMARKA